MLELLRMMRNAQKAGWLTKLKCIIGKESHMHAMLNKLIEKCSMCEGNHGKPSSAFGCYAAIISNIHGKEKV